jgi:hypothetical protein
MASSPGCAILRVEEHDRYTTLHCSRYMNSKLHGIEESADLEDVA